MTISSVICAVNPPPPTPATPSLNPCHPSKAIQIPCSRRSQCFSIVASVIIGSSTVGFSWGGESFVLDKDSMAAALVETEGHASRWSDRRMCPQWRMNSLENNVPENLPRPSSRLKFNEVAVDSTAPGVSVGSSCFSM